MVDIKNPLGPQDLAEINQRLRELDDVEILIAQATRGGLDVKEQAERAREARTKLMQLKQSFFPGQ